MSITIEGANLDDMFAIDDLLTLPAVPDKGEVLRLARYRRTLAREARADYAAPK